MTPPLSSRLSINPAGQLVRTTPGGMQSGINGIWQYGHTLLFRLSFFY